jgi:aspartate/methionine/tyrosine aminotransferase
MKVNHIITSAYQSAKRLRSVSEYYFSTKLKEIAALNAQGRNIISLGIGSPDAPPSAATVEALCREAQKPTVHGYQSYTGIPELREAFAAWYKKWFGVDLCPATEIQPLIGSKEGILYVSLAFLNPGDGVLVPNPGYPTYTSVGRLVQANVIPYALNEANGWQPDFDALEKTGLSNVKLMWVNYPNMPTGAAASRGLFERLAAFGKKHRIVVCNDNPYSFILNDQRLSLLSVAGAKDGCLELNSMSKSHNMAGWRIGMLASNARFIEWILKVKSNVDSGMFRPLQMAAVAALHNTEQWHREMNIERYARRRVLAEAIFDRLGCRFDKDQVGLFLWGKIPATCESSAAFADNLLYEAGVFVTPGFVFGTRGERYIRLSLCADEAMLQEALRRVKS